MLLRPTGLTHCVAARVTFLGETLAHPLQNVPDPGPWEAHMCSPQSLPHRTPHLGFLRSQGGRLWLPSISNHTLVWSNGADFLSLQYSRTPSFPCDSFPPPSIMETGKKTTSTHFLTPPGWCHPLKTHPVVLHTFLGRNLNLGQQGHGLKGPCHSI